MERKAYDVSSMGFPLSTIWKDRDVAGHAGSTTSKDATKALYHGMGLEGLPR